MFKILTDLLGDVLGSKTSSGSSQLLELFKGNKEKLREFELKMEAAYQDRLKLEIGDMQNARLMQMEALKQNDPFAKRFIYVLGGGLCIAAVTANLLPFFMEMPANSEIMINKSSDFFNYVVAGSVISFFMGSKINKK